MSSSEPKYTYESLKELGADELALKHAPTIVGLLERLKPSFVPKPEELVPMRDIGGVTESGKNITSPSSAVTESGKNITSPSREWYIKLHEELCARMVGITKRKNADYTGGSDDDDAFANFRQVERLGICSVEQGFLTRMTDKMSRINSFVKKGTLQVQDESVEDTLLDLANYSLLMLGYIKSKKEVPSRSK